MREDSAALLRCLRVEAIAGPMHRGSIYRQPIPNKRQWDHVRQNQKGSADTLLCPTLPFGHFVRSDAAEKVGQCEKS